MGRRENILLITYDYNVRGLVELSPSCLSKQPTGQSVPQAIGGFQIWAWRRSPRAPVFLPGWLFTTSSISVWRLSKSLVLKALHKHFHIITKCNHAGRFSFQLVAIKELLNSLTFSLVEVLKLMHKSQSWLLLVRIMNQKEYKDKIQSIP